MYFVSVITPNYLNRAKPFLYSLPLVRSCKVKLVLLDFNEQTDPDGQIELALRTTCDWLPMVKMDLPPTHSSFMVQDSFINAFPEITDDEWVILSDADVVVQRDFNVDELCWIEDNINPEWGCNDTDIAAYYNCGVNDNLELEAKRIDLSSDWKLRFASDDVLRRIHCLNCGLMIGRAGVYRRVQTEYQRLCEEFYAAAPHRSRCQFLLNYIWWRLGLNVKVLPHTFHQHAHLRSSEGEILLSAPNSELRFYMVCVEDGTPVVIRHNFPF